MEGRNTVARDFVAPIGDFQVLDPTSSRHENQSTWPLIPDMPVLTYMVLLHGG